MYHLAEKVVFFIYLHIIYTHHFDKFADYLRLLGSVVYFIFHFFHLFS